MSIHDLLQIYSPKLATQIILYMREQNPNLFIFSLDNFKKKFDKSKKEISRNLNILYRDGLIDKEYIAESYAYGPRLRVSLTAKGLKLAKKLSYMGLNDDEKKKLCN